MPRYIDADAIEPSEIVIPLIDGGYEYVEVVYMDDLRDIPTADVVSGNTVNGYGWAKKAIRGSCVLFAKAKRMCQQSWESPKYGGTARTAERI